MIKITRLNNFFGIVTREGKATSDFSRAWDQVATVAEQMTNDPVEAPVTATGYIPVTLPNGVKIKIAIVE